MPQSILHTITPDSTVTNSSDEVYAAIKQAICQTRYAPGEYLREEQIARSLGVSRTPVREALRRLSAEGWLEVRPNHGARVRVWSVRDVEEIFEARILIEPYLTGRAATRMSASETATIAALADEMLDIAQRPGTAETTDAWFNANRSFHEIISLAAGNARLNQSLKSMKEVPLIKWTFDNFDLIARERSARQHIEVVQAIEHRDAAWAEAVMKCHILSAQKTVLGKLRQAHDPD
jgi:DNA-binding GntR family transcriptional regulator